MLNLAPRQSALLLLAAKLRVDMRHAGDVAGHEFHGNQWTQAQIGESKRAIKDIQARATGRKGRVMNIDHLQKLSTKDLQDLHHHYDVIGSHFPQSRIREELQKRGQDIRSASRHPESAIHAAADAHMNAMTVAVMYGFLKGRKALHGSLKALGDSVGHEFHGNQYTSSGLSQAHHEALIDYQEHTWNKGTVTVITGHTTPGGKYEHLHPGAITVYRGTDKGSISSSKPSSWSKSRAIAEKNGSTIHKLKLTKDMPALDINKAIGETRHSHEQEVYVGEHSMRSAAGVPDVDACVSAIHAALLKVLPPVLAKCYVAGGNVAVKMLPKRIRAAGEKICGSALSLSQRCVLPLGHGDKHHDGTVATWGDSQALRAAVFNPDQERDDHGRWTGGGSETLVRLADQQIDRLPQVDATGAAEGFIDNADSVRNPLLPKHVDPEEDAVTEYVAEKYAPIAQEIFDAGLQSKGDVRSIPINRIDTQQATLSKSKLKDYVAKTGWEKEAGIAVRYGRNFLLIDGNHRVVAAKMRGETHVKLRVVSDTAKMKGAEAMRTLDDTFNIRFDVSSPEAIKWAREHTSKIADDISQTSKDRINEAVAQALEGDGLDAAYDDILAAVGDEARADMIARTEVMTAANEGNREGWNQAVEAGLLTGDEKRVWIATSDACPECEELDEQEADLDGEYPNDGGDGPPLHPNCRCTEGLSVGGGE